jgi:hypothetical protein
MISHKHKVIFVHLRRTAGNSIELALGGISLFDKDELPTDRWINRLHRGRRNRYKHDQRGHWLHCTASQIQKRHPQEFKDYFKFSVVRNPWAQMASLYGFCFGKKTRDPDHFESWLLSFNRDRRVVQRPAKRALIGTVPHFSLFDSRGNLLVDEICRFENLVTDFETVKEKAKITLQPLVSTNAGPSIDYVKKYSTRAREHVSNIYAEDIERFGYKFEE